MTQVECEVDSIRIASACPDELALILKRKESPNAYLPLWISQREGQILADVLHRRPDSDKELDAFFTHNNAADLNIEGTTIYSQGSTFLARVLFSRHQGHCEVGCPIGVALALAVRANAPIQVDEALFDTAGVLLE